MRSGMRRGPTYADTRTNNIVLWILQVALAIMFLNAGIPKLVGDPQMVQMFATIGIGQWFRYLTGGIEVSSAVMLLTAPLAGIGALLLVCTMVGAVLTHIFIIGGNPAMAIGLLLGSVIVAYGRRHRTPLAFLHGKRPHMLGPR